MINYFLQNPEIWVLIFGIVIGAGIAFLITLAFNMTERHENGCSRTGLDTVRPGTNTERKGKRIRGL